MRQLLLHGLIMTLVAVGATMPGFAVAAESVIISEVPEEYSLRPHIEYIDDGDRALTWEDVLKPEGESLRVLIRVDTSTPLWTPMNLWSPRLFLKKGIIERNN